ncbi:MAG: zinc-ribbon domain-containing protein [Tepidisphaeraceae bacterium]
MFCEKCGKPMSPDAQFCISCGAPAARQASGAGNGFAPAVNRANSLPPRTSNEPPLLVLQPVFVGWATVFAVLPIQLFLTVWAAGFCGGFSMLGLAFVGRVFHVKFPPGSTFIFWGILAFFGVPLVAYWSKRSSYAKAEYRFYRDRLEYISSSFSQQEKTVDYRSILEVDLKIGPVQKGYNIGTLVLSTPASFGDRSNVRGGIRVADIPDPKVAYEQVRRLIQDAQGR